MHGSWRYRRHMADAYAQRIRDWRRRTPRSVGDAFAESDDMYDAYTWYLIAAALGDDEAAERLDGMETAELVCDEDRYLANLQVAIWFELGIVVDRDPALALARLEDAAFPFVELPPIDELRAAPDFDAARNAAWTAALAKLGFPPNDRPVPAVDRATVAAIVARILAITGWPATLDFALPLGPSMPDRPYWLHTRHAI